jgi:hypothetical protein
VSQIQSLLPSVHVLNSPLLQAELQSTKHILAYMHYFVIGQDRSVIIAMGYGPTGSVHFLRGARIFQYVQNSNWLWSHAAFHTVDNGCLSTRGKVAQA